jgi:hypothetical protein
VITTRETGDHDREIGDHDAAKQVITMRRFVRSRWPGARINAPPSVLIGSSFEPVLLSLPVVPSTKIPYSLTTHFGASFGSAVGSQPSGTGTVPSGPPSVPPLDASLEASSADAHVFVSAQFAPLSPQCSAPSANVPSKTEVCFFTVPLLVQKSAEKDRPSCLGSTMGRRPVIVA